MKWIYRFVLSLFLVSLLIPLTGCERVSAKGAALYYIRAEYQYDDTQPVIVPEQRDLFGHEGDPAYVLRQYTAGPTTQGLVSPFPSGSRFTELEIADATAFVTVSGEALSLNDSKFSLAAACLALTLGQDGSISALTLRCEERSVTVTLDSLLLYESPFPEEGSTTPGVSP